MTGKRGGRVQVNVLQYMELVQRVEELEKAVYGKPDSMTKNEVIEKLKESGIEFNPRDKKEVLMSLLEE